jgi:hypothetical protein
MWCLRPGRGHLTLTTGLLVRVFSASSVRPSPTPPALVFATVLAVRTRTFLEERRVIY